MSDKYIGTISKYKLTCVIIVIAIIAITMITLLPGTSIADEVEPASINDVVAAFQDKFNDSSSNSITTFLFERAKVLFWLLAFIQVAWNLYHFALEGRLEIQTIIFALARQIFLLGVMYYFLNNAQNIFNAIISSFLQAGKQVADISSEASDVAGVLDLGFKVVGELWNSIENIPSGLLGIDKFPIYFIAGICAIIVLVSFAFASLTFIIAQCKLYMSAMVAIYFVGFASCDFTRNIAITAFKAVFCSAIEVFVMFILFGIASNFFPTLLSDVTLDGEPSNFYPVLCQVIVATFVFCGGLKILPQFASGIIAGSPLGGGSAMGSGQALAGAVAGGVATGLATAAGMAFGGVGGVVAAKASGAGTLGTIGRAIGGMAKGGYGGQQGQMGNIMRSGAQNAILRGLQRNQNSASKPNQNPNNVSPN